MELPLPKQPPDPGQESDLLEAGVAQHGDELFGPIKPYLVAYDEPMQQIPGDRSNRGIHCSVHEEKGPSGVESFADMAYRRRGILKVVESADAGRDRRRRGKGSEGTKACSFVFPASNHETRAGDSLRFGFPSPDPYHLLGEIEADPERLGVPFESAPEEPAGPAPDVQEGAANRREAIEHEFVLLAIPGGEAVRFVSRGLAVEFARDARGRIAFPAIIGAGHRSDA